MTAMEHKGFDGETDFGSPVFARLRAEAGPAWGAYTNHAFVAGLADGSLPRANFLHYLVQDYVFLHHYARAWALAVVKSETPAEARFAAGTVDALLNTELALHVGVCAEAGISEDALESAAEERENLAYTRYVLESGLTGDFLDLVAALAPCALGYGEIGARLAREASPDTPYRAWIDTYSGKDYQDVCHRVARLLEETAASRLGPDPVAVPRWAFLSKRFRTATELEIGFWDMGLRGGALPESAA
ncbi:thiaminase II [Stappia sp.]|uniref:thiaminase II n=1 Tax=Stappia sp. TaxID=1870903 RepID=UPI003D111F4A